MSEEEKIPEEHPVTPSATNSFLARIAERNGANARAETGVPPTAPEAVLKQLVGQGKIFLHEPKKGRSYLCARNEAVETGGDGKQHLQGFGDVAITMEATGRLRVDEAALAKHLIPDAAKLSPDKLIEELGHHLRYAGIKSSHSVVGGVVDTVRKHEGAAGRVAQIVGRRSGGPVWGGYSGGGGYRGEDEKEASYSSAGGPDAALEKALREKIEGEKQRVGTLFEVVAISPAFTISQLRSTKLIDSAPTKLGTNQRITLAGADAGVENIIRQLVPSERVKDVDGETRFLEQDLLDALVKATDRAVFDRAISKAKILEALQTQKFIVSPKNGDGIFYNVDSGPMKDVLHHWKRGLNLENTGTHPSTVSRKDIFDIAEMDPHAFNRLFINKVELTPQETVCALAEDRFIFRKKGCGDVIFVANKDAEHALKKVGIYSKDRVVEIKGQADLYDPWQGDSAGKTERVINEDSYAGALRKEQIKHIDKLIAVIDPKQQQEQRGR